MSNVLIGIIGVILFIGLALAGALFLGPRFQQSTNDSKASAAVQAVSQVGQALEMYRVQEGRQFADPAGPSKLVGTYLKSMPLNPTDPSEKIALTLIPNGTGGYDMVSYMFLVPQGVEDVDPVVVSICKAVNKQTKGNEQFVTIAQLLAHTAPPTGCWEQNGTYNVYSISG